MFQPFINLEHYVEFELQESASFIFSWFDSEESAQMSLK